MSIELKIEDKVATVIINRPEKKNALTLEMRHALIATFEQVALDEQVRAIVLTGAGSDFCSGADVGAMGGHDLVAGRARMGLLQKMVQSIYNSEKPVIAAVPGAAVGVGWSLALACDMTIAADNAKFSQVFTKVGLAPDGGSAYFLTRQLGMPRVKELIYGARLVRAVEALALGLVNRVVPDAELQSVAHAMARELADAPTFAITLSKKLIHASVAPSLDAFLEMERLIQPQLTQTTDHAEGVAAFMEKRQPKFTGH